MTVGNDRQCTACAKNITKSMKSDYFVVLQLEMIECRSLLQHVGVCFLFLFMNFNHSYLNVWCTRLSVAHAFDASFLMTVKFKFHVHRRRLYRNPLIRTKITYTHHQMISMLFFCNFYPDHNYDIAHLFTDTNLSAKFLCVLFCY